MPSALASHWRLDPEVTFLNHGSYGACPVEVLEAQSEWRARLEHQPVTPFALDLEDLDRARAVRPVVQERDLGIESPMDGQG